jgi:hypothetical protein
MVMCNAHIFALLFATSIYLFIYSILGENAICWSVVEYFSGSLAAGL